MKKKYKNFNNKKIIYNNNLIRKIHIMSKIQMKNNKLLNSQKLKLFKYQILPNNNKKYSKINFLKMKSNQKYLKKIHN